MRRLEAFRGHLLVLANNNLKASKDKRFVADMTDTLVPGLLRLHTGGDFYSPEYTRKWYKILKTRSDIISWAYTRSWRVKGFIGELRKLNNLPNVEILLSFDPEMTHPKFHGITDFRTAYLPLEENSMFEPKDPDADLVLRLHKYRKKVKLMFGNSPVCPTENGLSQNNLMKKPTCSVCRYCFQGCDDAFPGLDLRQLAEKWKGKISNEIKAN